MCHGKQKKKSDKEQGGGNSDGDGERKESRREKSEREYWILGVVGRSKGLVHEQVHLS